MQDLNISLIQSELHWHSIEANLAMFEEKIWQLDQKSDVIILPEMFNTGFTMKVSLGEPMNSKTFRWMRQMASQTKAILLGSYIVNEKGNHFNRLLWMEPSGDFAYYDKRHLFRMADEHNSFTEGSELLIKSWKGWNICPLVCYDLRFPVWSRNRVNSNHSEYDLLVYVANWPQARVQAWDALLKARAIENACYSIGLNRVGTDGNGVQYNGHSAAYNCKGDTLFQAGEIEGLHSFSLEYQSLVAYRKAFPVHLDADDFEIKM